MNPCCQLCGVDLEPNSLKRFCDRCESATPTVPVEPQSDEDVAVMIGGTARYIVSLRSQGRFNIANVVRALEDFRKDLQNEGGSVEPQGDAARAEGFREGVEAALEIVQSEPELPGPMPNDVQREMAGMGLAEALRAAVRATKSEIERRISLLPQRSGERE